MADTLPLMAESQPQDSTLRALLHSMADGVFLVDNAGRMSVWNTPMEKLAGMRSADSLGQPYATLFDKLAALSEEAGAVRRDLENALEQIHERPVLYMTLRPPHAHLLQLHLFPVEGGAGEALGWGGLARDLSQADETNLLTTVSHELRSPLAAIKGYVTTLLDNVRRWDTGTIEEFLETINDSADQLSNLVENMLDMARLERGSLRLQWRSLDLPDLAARVAEAIQLRAPRHRFVLQFADDFPRPQADGLRLAQVLRNLLQNAVNYSPRGGVITISGQAAADSVTVSVRDEGIGIRPDERVRVFERFYQGEDAQAALARGVGLGLYICRRIIEAHGGRIWAESPEAGPGSIFAFQLPLAPAAEAGLVATSDSWAEARPVLSPLPFQMRSSEGGRILVVEDDKRLLRFVRANLESSGYEAIAVMDGEAAIEAVERELPDLILLDVMMPKLDGFAVCRRVREFSQVPIIMLTARTDEADRVRGLDLGADDYLTKPFGTNELLARVRAVLRRSQFPEEVQTQPALVCGELTMDFAQRQVRVGGRAISLTPTEYKLLYHLAINAGRVLTHEQLLRKVWGPAYETETAYVWVYISRLRKKLEPEPDQPTYILSETGVGYRFTA